MQSQEQPQRQPSSTTGTIALDHIVILVPYSFLALPGLNTHPSSSSSPSSSPGPPKWFQELFTFSPGGRHSDGLTENVLVLLPDGVYLEFIAFTPEAAEGKEQEGPAASGRKGHKWGGFEEGSIVDWAVTVYHPNDEEENGNGKGSGSGSGSGRAQEDFDNFVKPVTDRIMRSINDQSSRVYYGDLIPGGRTRPDGVQLEWAVVPAVKGKGGGGHGGKTAIRPGQAPFWCLDETPRRFRVPYHKQQQQQQQQQQQRPSAAVTATEHPNTGAVGVAGIQVTPGPGVEIRDLQSLYGQVFGDSGRGEAWRLAAPEGTRFHPDGRLSLDAGGDDGARAGDVVVSLYTDKPELIGKRVGGDIGVGGRGIWFELVGV